MYDTIRYYRFTIYIQVVTCYAVISYKKKMNAFLLCT